MNPCPRDIAELEAALSRPTPELVEAMRQIQGDIMVLGAGGKMGPSLARMAKRASDQAGVKRAVMAVARFSSPEVRVALQEDGIRAIICDLLDETALAGLPSAPNIVFMAGMKFGSAGHEPLTWAMNTHLPGLVCRRFPRSLVVAFSTGNIYGLVSPETGGSRESDTPNPVGEYAMSCLGRERILEHFSRARGTPVAVVRLNYACDLRYGVLVDLAEKILAGAPVDLGISWFNTIWQADANAMALRCLTRAATPPLLLNVTGPEILNVKETCERLGKLLGRAPKFVGEPGPNALLSNAGRAFGLFGQPSVRAAQLIDWIAEWLKAGRPTLRKPTHFESRDGKF